MTVRARDDMTQEQVDAILLLRRTGWTVARISVALGVGYDVVRAVVAVTGTARGVVRSMPAYCDLAERGRAEGWQVMALDLPIDPTTPQGELVYGVLVLSAQFERRLLAQRVKEAMASRRVPSQDGLGYGVEAHAAGGLRGPIGRRPGSGAPLPACAGEVHDRRRRGEMWQAIADDLNLRSSWSTPLRWDKQPPGSFWYWFTARKIRLADRPVVAKRRF